MAHKQLTVCKSLINSKVNETLNNKCTQNNLLSTSVQIITALRINITFKNTFKNKYYSYSVVLNNLSGIQLKTLRININNINNIQRVLDYLFFYTKIHVLKHVLMLCSTLRVIKITEKIRVTCTENFKEKLIKLKKLER